MAAIGSGGKSAHAAFLATMPAKETGKALRKAMRIAASLHPSVQGPFDLRRNR